MDDRTAVIVKEIKYWKEHRLLPEKYCDYLLALYTNGQELYDEAEVSNARNGLTPVIIIHFILLLAMIPFSLLVVYFTEFHLLLQLSILIVFLFYSIWIYLYFRKYSYEFVLVALIVSLLLLLLVSIILSSLLTTSIIIHTIVILMNLLLWLLISYAEKNKLLQIVSILSLIFAIGYIIFNKFIA
ncbi:hypothetical protein [Oceanobacillus rekensis]|uniref:hypothetical protein n=1 Tax=Oceanobacillus rekensis TaxID=937927 RepID=UPI000B44818C|nr:hypothetical protein [Oceanobacillus rekensis]